MAKRQKKHIKISKVIVNGVAPKLGNLKLRNIAVLRLKTLIARVGKGVRSYGETPDKNTDKISLNNWPGMPLFVFCLFGLNSTLNILVRKDKGEAPD